MIAKSVVHAMYCADFLPPRRTVSFHRHLGPRARLGQDTGGEEEENSHIVAD